MSANYPNQDLDLALLYEIADGSNQFIVESIDMFLQQTPVVLQNISEYLDEMNWVAAGAAAHKLKPTVGFFGMAITEGLMRDIELSCKAGAHNPVDIITKFNQAVTIINENTDILMALKAEVARKL